MLSCFSFSVRGMGKVLSARLVNAIPRGLPSAAASCASWGRFLSAAEGGLQVDVLILDVDGHVVEADVGARERDQRHDLVVVLFEHRADEPGDQGAGGVVAVAGQVGEFDVAI